MQKQFESNIIKNQLFSKKDKLLLAISGGMDSVVLAHLLKKAKFSFSLAHCNFKLRGKDSDADEKFCRNLAERSGLDFYTRSFDVEKYAAKHGQSIQMAARNLRYAFFYELLEAHQFDYIVTAHHSSDLIETVLINLLRGTGINGLVGIPVKKYTTVRPLLYFSRDEVKEFATNNGIKFRLDKSNLEDKYERNFIRLNVVPLLRKINPSLETTFVKNSDHFRKDALIVRDFLKSRRDALVTVKGGTVSIDKISLKKEEHIENILHFMISDYGFNPTHEKNIIKNIVNDSDSGKIFSSAKYILTIDRKEILIQPKQEKKTGEIKIHSIDELEKTGLFVLNKEHGFNLPLKNELFLDGGKIIFPMIIRRKKTGDKFKPFGMKGFKLLSDFLKDEKLNRFEKENVRLLVNGNGEIIWVIGYRSDERYRVDKQKKDLVKLTLIE